MEIMFLGGSNTFVRNGYVASILNSIREKFEGEEIKANNYSVGISACPMGIEQFLLMGKADNPNIIFIEYAINDTSITATFDYTYWRKSYEGLIRMLLQRWPNTRIFGLVFASSNSDHRKRIEVMRTMLDEFIARYNRFKVIDVDTVLRQRYNDVGVYRDVMHYSASVYPDIADLVVEAITTKPADMDNDVLPPPLTADPFDDSSVVTLADIPGQRIQQFRNSSFDFMSVILEPDESVTLSIPGEIAAVTFVSSANSGILEITDSGGKNFVSTLHSGVAAGQFNALIMNAPRLWHDWKSPLLQSQQITLTCRRKVGTPFRSFFSMIEPTTDAVVVQLRSILVANSRGVAVKHNAG